MFERHFAQLIIYDRDSQIKTVLMNQPQVSIGREKAGSPCDIQVSSDLVSSSHGLFSFYNGEYYYTDCLNVNGTYLNGVKIQKHPGRVSDAQKLRDGDILSIGVTDISKDRTVYILFSTSTNDDYVWNALSLNSFGNSITIGRDVRQCDIVLSKATVSKRHAIIVKDNMNRLAVADLKSVNGTLLNGSLIKPNVKYRFKERDTITIASTKVINLGNAIVYNQPKMAQYSSADDYVYHLPDNVVNDNAIRSVYIENRPVFDNQQFTYHRLDLENQNNQSRVYDRKGGVELRVEHVSKIVSCKKGTGINGGDKKYILEDISLTIYPSELVAILGGSGAGKTTFMNAINGFEPGTSGSVYFNGNDLYKNYQAYKSQIGYVPQQDIVYDNLTMNDMLTYVAKLRLPGDFSKEELAQRVDEVLNAMALQKQKHTLIKKLSGGQKKRASIAVELISDPSLFFLDEPTSGLDPEAETNLMKQLQMLSSQKGKTILVITHTLQNIHLFDKVIFLAPGGKLCFYGSPDDAKKFFEVDNLSDAYEKISTDIDMYVNKFKRTMQ